MMGIMKIVRFIAGNALVQYAAIALFAFAAYKTHVYFERREAVREAQEAGKQKDQQENKRIQRAAEEDEQQHHETVEKSRKATEQDIEKISRIRPHQCLDVRLNDIGLQ